MKTTFKQYLQETTMPDAKTVADLFGSIKDGKFTLDGSKLEVPFDFFCHHQKLKSLIGAPVMIAGTFNCAENQLVSLEGAPSGVGAHFDCENNLLTSLKGAPSIVAGRFDAEHNLLTSLEGAPKFVGGNFFVSYNQLTSLEGIHKLVNEIGGDADFEGNPIKSHVLGLLKIKSLRRIGLDNYKVQEIINMYLPEGDMFACQQELIDAGLEDFAQL